MNFIKRHLIGVVLLVLGIGAIAGGVMYMLGNQSKGAEADQQLMLATNQLMAVTMGGGMMGGSAPMPPTSENIKVLVNNTEVVRDFISKAKETVKAEPLPVVTPAAFGIYLPQALNELKVAALAARVTYPTNEFDFSFHELRGETQFIPYTIPPLVEQLHDIKSISAILIQSQVAAFEKVERVSVSPKETKGAPMYLTDLRPYTNSVATVVPYRFTVRCLSGALSKALIALGSAPGFCVVKTIEVDPWDPNAPAGGALPPGIAPMGVIPGAVFPGVVLPGVVRPGVGLPGVGLPGPALTNLTPVARTVLDEKLLRVVLVIEISRPLSEQPKAVAPAVAPGAPPAGISN